MSDKLKIVDPYNHYPHHETFQGPFTPLKLDFDDVLIVPQPSDVNSRAEVNLRRKFPFRNGQTIVGIPIIAANMKNIGTIPVAYKLKEHNIFTALTKGECTTPSLWEHAFETFGIGDTSLLSNKLLCLDVANGYTSEFVAWVAYVRKKYPTSIIMAGNVATGKGVRSLAEAGADIIKVGMGSGSACTTRIKTGVGVPQFSAVLVCAKAAHSLGVYICSDGGHRTPGDIVKSYAAGADFVMLGGMLCGTEETGQWLYGNASRQVQGELEKYKAEEGKAIPVKLRGSLDDVVLDILGGLRSSCSYVGAKNLEELHEKAEFVRVR